jgi:hypothetical protein
MTYLSEEKRFFFITECHDVTPAVTQDITAYVSCDISCLRRGVEVKAAGAQG